MSARQNNFLFCLLIIFVLPNILYSYNFKLKDSNYKEVYVVGDFNNWNPLSDKMENQNGVWQKEIKLNKGTFKYQFIADGNIITDPQNSNKELDKKSMTNVSILTVEPAAEEILTGIAANVQNNLSKKYLVPLKLYYGNYTYIYPFIYIKCENKVSGELVTERAYFNYIDYSYTGAINLPEGIYNYYFTDAAGNNFYNSNLPNILDKNMNKNSIVVNGRYFTLQDNLKNYIANELIILTNKNNFEICALKNNLESINIFFKILDITFEYPLMKKASTELFDIYFLDQDISNFKLSGLEYCFRVKNGIYNFYLDREGLKSSNDNLKLLEY